MSKASQQSKLNSLRDSFNSCVTAIESENGTITYRAKNSANITAYFVTEEAALWWLHDTQKEVNHETL